MMAGGTDLLPGSQTSFRSAGMPQQAGTISQNINRLYRDLAPNSFGTKQSLKQSR